MAMAANFQFITVNAAEMYSCRWWWVYLSYVSQWAYSTTV